MGSIEAKFAFEIRIWGVYFSRDSKKLGQTSLLLLLLLPSIEI
jgi:hypothetical protein